MVKTLSWKNPYIDALQTLPETIIDLPRDKNYGEACARIQQTMEKYSGTVVEIGSGSGAHLIGQAAKSPARLHIGFELRYKRAFRTAEKAAQADLENLLVIRGDANCIAELFPICSLAGIYINFPDPWSKKKWNKHRIISEKNLTVYHQLIKHDGFFSYKTDHQEYFKASLALIRTMGTYDIEWYTEDLWQSCYNSENIATEFEMLFRSKKLPIYALFAKKSDELAQRIA